MDGILHAHSTFSLHDSGQSPLELVLKAKELGIPNVTLTDHGTMLGLDDFMEAGKEHGINAIPGLEAYLEDRSHLLLVARDLEGYKAISFALRDANENQQKIRKLVYPKMTAQTISKYLVHNEHIIVTSACVNGPLGKILLSGQRMEREIEKKQKKSRIIKAGICKLGAGKPEVSVICRRRKNTEAGEERFYFIYKSRFFKKSNG